MDANIDDPEWAHGVDADKPSAARMYDYFLGGSHNFQVDREAARKVLEARPSIRYMAHANRSFLNRAVRFAAQAGVRQFLDIGSGIPTVGNVHEVAARVVADPAVVYVDNDPVAVVHATNLLAGERSTVTIDGDLRDPAGILGHPEVGRLLNLDEPVALLIVSVLHFVPGDEAYGCVTQLRDAMASGSYLVLSHVTYAPFSADEISSIRQVYDKSRTPGGPRTREEIERFFAGYDVVDPGVVWLDEWRPNDAPTDEPERSGLLAGVGIKP